MARASYGKLVAILAAKTGDVAAAEDALSVAFARALTTWPARGVPQNPEGWLVTVAKNAHKDLRKSAAERTRADVSLDEFEVPATDSVPDKRLALMFACAHPAINVAVRAPLMCRSSSASTSRSSRRRT